MENPLSHGSNIPQSRGKDRATTSAKSTDREPSKSKERNTRTAAGPEQNQSAQTSHASPANHRAQTLPTFGPDSPGTCGKSTKTSPAPFQTTENPPPSSGHSHKSLSARPGYPMTPPGTA